MALQLSNDIHEELFFPVRKVPIYADLDGWIASGRQRERLHLFPASPIRVRGKSAILDEERKRVLAVVSDDYRIVTNEEAVDYGKQCCRFLFPEAGDGQWKMALADMASTRGHCHVDLIHNVAECAPGWDTANRGLNTYGPFVRVTNSYNCTRSLQFDIGFVRKVCENGLILPKANISFKFHHVRRQIPESFEEALEFQARKPEYQRYKKSFLDFLDPLKKCRVTAEAVPQVALLALGIRAPSLQTPATLRRWARLNEHAEALSRKYAVELGCNGNAILNVVTDLATRPKEAGIAGRGSHSLQRRAGEWMAEFARQCSKPSFDLTGYVAELAQREDGDGTSPTPA